MTTSGVQMRDERIVLVLDWKAQQKVLLHHRVRHYVPGQPVLSEVRA